MKRLLFLAFISLAGCKKDAAPPAEPEVARTRPVGAEQPMNLEMPDRARVELDLANARAAVRTMSQLNGANPRSLSEMNVKLSYPADLEYDAASGTVKSKTYPML